MRDEDRREIELLVKRSIQLKVTDLKRQVRKQYEGLKINEKFNSLIDKVEQTLCDFHISSIGIAEISKKLDDLTVKVVWDDPEDEDSSPSDNTSISEVEDADIGEILPDPDPDAQE